MIRVLYLEDQHERHLELAARYLRRLYEAERLHALEDWYDLEALFAGIDPVDVKIVGQELELLRSLYRVAPTQLATEPRAAPLSRSHSRRSGDDGSRPDGADTPSSVAFFPQSLRVSE